MTAASGVLRRDPPGRTPLRLAMWSGPRNVSTALMRSWENRGDTLVVDEPFYGHYLAITGLRHPGADEVIASQSRDWRVVAASLHAPLPAGVRVHYQKHMSHHLLPGMGREWLDGLTHAFLLRDPREMLLSLDQKLDRITVADSGLAQQVEIFDYVRAKTGTTPAVIDAHDLLANPRAMLMRLCDVLGIDFTERMLAWRPGRRDTDGVWAKYWYHAVESSTGFSRWQPREGVLAPELEAVERECRPLYDRLFAHRLKI